MLRNFEERGQKMKKTYPNLNLLQPFLWIIFALSMNDSNSLIEKNLRFQDKNKK